MLKGKLLRPMAAVLIAGCASVPEPPPRTTEIEVPPPSLHPALQPAPAPETFPDPAVAEAPPPPVEAPPPPVEAPPPPPVEAMPPPASGRPTQTDDGVRRVVATSERTAAQAARRARKLEAQGLRAEIQVVEVDGKTWNRVVVPGLSSLEDARAMAAWLQANGFPTAWVLPKNASTAGTSAPAATAPAGEPTATRPPETVVEIPVQEQPAQ